LKNNNNVHDTITSYSFLGEYSVAIPLMKVVPERRRAH